MSDITFNKENGTITFLRNGVLPPLPNGPYTINLYLNAQIKSAGYRFRTFEAPNSEVTQFRPTLANQSQVLIDTLKDGIWPFNFTVRKVTDLATILDTITGNIIVSGIGTDAEDWTIEVTKVVRP